MVLLKLVFVAEKEREKEKDFHVSAVTFSVKIT